MLSTISTSQITIMLLIHTSDIGSVSKLIFDLDAQTQFMHRIIKICGFIWDFLLF